MRIYLCPQCDSQLPEGALFCPRCGAAIAWGAPAQQAAVAPSTEQPTVEEPSSRASAQSTDAHDSSSHEQLEALPLPENIAGVLSYLTLIPAVVFLYVEPFRRNRFVRFHAMQHILLFGAGVAFTVVATIVWSILQLLPFMRVLVFPFVGLISLAWMFLWMLLVLKAYHHEIFKLPWIGDYAEELSRAQR